MSNNFKFYINSYNFETFENELREVYVFIKNNYFMNKDLQSVEELKKLHPDWSEDKIYDTAYDYVHIHSNCEEEEDEEVDEIEI